LNPKLKNLIENFLSEKFSSMMIYGYALDYNGVVRRSCSLMQVSLKTREYFLLTIFLLFFSIRRIRLLIGIENSYIRFPRDILLKFTTFRMRLHSLSSRGRVLQHVNLKFWNDVSTNIGYYGYRLKSKLELREQFQRPDKSGGL